jgi:gliding motility-associated-like protein
VLKLYFKIIQLFFYPLIGIGTCLSQNLVPNPSFEDHFDCTFGGIENATYWCGVNSCSYYNICNPSLISGIPTNYWSPGFPSFQYPHTGNAHASMGFIFPTQPLITPSRYPHIKLKDTLEAGKTYCVSYYVSLWNDCKYSTDKFGALFTTTGFDCLISPQNLYGQIPQVVSSAGVLYDDTLGWQEVSGLYIATGNEAYLTLGNFFITTAHTYSISYPGSPRFLAEYYLDDVSVEEVQLARCAKDSAICQGDSIQLGNNASEAAIYNWLPNLGLSCSTCANPKAAPLSSTTYTCFKTQCKVNTTDVVSITIKTDCVKDIIIPNVFTPNGDGANDTFKIKLYNAILTNFSIYNRWGLLIKSDELNTHNYLEWDGRTTTGEECTAGVYFYTLQYTDANGNIQKKNGYITLIK